MANDGSEILVDGIVVEIETRPHGFPWCTTTEDGTAVVGFSKTRDDIAKNVRDGRIAARAQK